MPKAKRIAILGGGAAALSAAWTIKQHDPDAEVTVYQMGWRLGGKGASGRNQDRNMRIEEHGLHVFLGFYQNAHRLMQQVYGELGRDPAKHAFASWHDAFKPHSVVALMEHFGNAWTPWFVPAEDELSTTPGDDWLPGRNLVFRRFARATFTLLRRHFRRLWDDATHGLGDPLTNPAIPITDRVLLELIRGLQFSIRQVLAVLNDNVEQRTQGAAADVGLAVLRGMIATGTHRTHDLESLDGQDLRAFLKEHGATPRSANSPLINGMYDLAFTRRGQAAAGTALMGLYRVGIMWEGSIFWKMQAGMGDIVFAPLYRALQRQQVEFRFFHRVDALRVDDETGIPRISEVCGTVQAETETGAYEPLLTIPRPSDGKAMEVWPSEPLYEQLKNGSVLRDSGQSFEDDHCTHSAGGFSLKRGDDFDELILGIGIGAFERIAEEVIRASPSFASMVKNVATTKTQALQLWIDHTTQELGWEYAVPPIVDGFAPPFDTWADMTHLLPAEGWTERAPRSIAYFCSDLPDSDGADVRANAVKWLETEARHLWPGASTRGRGFDWTLLHTRTESKGHPIDEQFFTSTLNESDRYVLSVPGSTQYRLWPWASGVEGLHLAGDWTRTLINVGAVEAAVQSGLLAAQGILGHDVDILPVDGELLEPTAAPRKLEVQGLSSKQDGYIERGGSLVLRPPITLHGATVDSFVIRADREQLQAVVTRDLEQVVSAGLRLRVPLGIASVVCARIARAASEHPLDRKKGYMPERDFGVWIPVLVYRDGPGRRWPKYVGVYQPYLFIDNVVAMTSGREAFGYHKQTATLSAPEDEGESTFTVKALAIEAFNDADPSNVTGRVQEIFSVQPLDDKVDITDFPLGRDEAADAMGDAITAAFEDDLKDADDLGFTRQALFRALFPAVKQVMLRQLPELADQRAAAIQEVVSWDARVTNFVGAALLPRHQATFQALDSHPIARELGLASTSNTVAAIRMKYDFRVETPELLGRR